MVIIICRFNPSYPDHLNQFLSYLKHMVAVGSPFFANVCQFLSNNYQTQVSYIGHFKEAQDICFMHVIVLYSYCTFLQLLFVYTVCLYLCNLLLCVLRKERRGWERLLQQRRLVMWVCVWLVCVRWWERGCMCVCINISYCAEPFRLTAAVPKLAVVSALNGVFLTVCKANRSWKESPFEEINS